MRKKRIGISVIAFGVAMIIVAMVLMLAIVPGMKKWPSDVDTTRYYEGTLRTMLNAEALQKMDVANILMKDVPITINRHFTTEETKGNKALVREVNTMYGPNKQTIMETDKWYPIDRKTTELVSNFTDNDKAVNGGGLIISFPISTEKEDYERWVSDLQTTAPLTYLREEKHAGINAYVFESKVPGGQIVDPSVLAALPPALPKATLSGLATVLGLPEGKKAALNAILPALPDMVPLKYTFEYGATYWVEPTTGMNIDIDKYEKRTAGLEIAGKFVPLTDVFWAEYKQTDASVAEAVDDARDAKDAIDLWGTTIPYAMIAVGVVLGALGLVFVLRR
ncbi:MAG: DUF3068 domain-containing protein [Dehalococcoidia bacterium]